MTNTSPDASVEVKQVGDLTPPLQGGVIQTSLRRRILRALWVVAPQKVIPLAYQYL